MNIPPATARAQGHHGIKGAAHGIKGGRPKLALTDAERAERRRQQHEAYRRRNGIPPREVLTWEERQERNQRQHDERWNKEYRRVWRKQPGVPLTAGEFAARQNAFRTWVRKYRGLGNRLYWPVARVRKHLREERQRQRAKWLESPDDGSPQEAAGRQTQTRSIQEEWQPWPPVGFPEAARPSVGRNEPCPCGSGRKFKKCCGP